MDPSRYETWPVEIRELFDRIVRLESEDSEAALEAYEHLSDLMKQREDETNALAAADAILALNARWNPEAAEELAAKIRRDTHLGDKIVEIMARNADLEGTPEERTAAEELLRQAIVTWPPKGRA
jgi:hypothetical protein